MVEMGILDTVLGQDELCFDNIHRFTGDENVLFFFSYFYLRNYAFWPHQIFLLIRRQDQPKISLSCSRISPLSNSILYLFQQ